MRRGRLLRPSPTTRPRLPARAMPQVFAGRRNGDAEGSPPRSTPLRARNPNGAVHRRSGDAGGFTPRPGHRPGAPPRAAPLSGPSAAPPTGEAHAARSRSSTTPSPYSLGDLTQLWPSGTDGSRRFSVFMILYNALPGAITFAVFALLESARTRRLTAPNPWLASTDRYGGSSWHLGRTWRFRHISHTPLESLALSEGERRSGEARAGDGEAPNRKHEKGRRRNRRRPNASWRQMWTLTF